MKRILFVTLLLFSLNSRNVWSQTQEEIKIIQSETNVTQLLRMSEQFQHEEIENRNKLLRLSKLKEWPLKKVSSKGENLLLTGVDEKNEPIYSHYLGFQFKISEVNNPDTQFIGPMSITAGITGRINKLYTDGGLGLDLHGESMTAGVWEFERVQTNHEAFLDPTTLQTRVIQKDSSQIDPTINAYHPNRTTGMIIASKSYFVEDATGSKTVNNMIGSAYKGNVFAYDTDNQISEITSAASQGLLASTHAYPLNGTFSAYSEGPAKLDSIMYYAPYYLSVWSCGNSGGPIDKLNNGSVMKNGLAVGATKYVPNYTGPSSVVEMSVGSIITSRGPSDDGRIKPDIVTQGEATRSAYQAGNVHYSTITTNGTSNSAPSLTGAILLLQQHYVNNNPLKFMRSSTAKALVLHTADEAGDFPGPDITFGWGLLNAEKAANTITFDGNMSYILESKLDLTSSIFSRDLVASGTEPLVATICWTDIPSTSRANNDTTRVLINDLDLRLSMGDSTYYPWKLDWSNGKVSVVGPAVKGDNNRDNVEKVEILNPIPGQNYTLTVKHKGNLVSNSQAFSLVVTGLEECVANRSIFSQVNQQSIDRQEASSSIVANNVLDFGSEVIYHAGDEVVLTDGFTGKDGTAFHGYLEGCTNNYTARISPAQRPVVTYSTNDEYFETELPENVIYPNPGSGLFTISLANFKEGKVEIYRNDGSTVFLKNFKQQQEISIDLRTEQSGVYFIKITSDNKVFKRRISKTQ